MRRKPLTAKQNQVLTMLINFTHRHHRQPSHSELKKLCYSEDVNGIIRQIEMRGWITANGQPRAIEIPDDVFRHVIEYGKLPPEAEQPSLAMVQAGTSKS